MDALAAVPGRRARSGRVDRARRLVANGGRFSSALGIDVGAGDREVERWFLAATLFGSRIPTVVAERTFHVLDDAGVTVAGAREFAWDALVALLDRGGYARYDFKTATRLHTLADALGRRFGGRVCAISDAARTPAELEQALDDLPGWGPVTVGLFLRELRDVWPLSTPALDARALSAAGHLGLLDPCTRDPLGRIRTLASAAGVDRRDLEAALVRVALSHRRGLGACPGGDACVALTPVAPRRDGEGG